MNYAFGKTRKRENKDYGELIMTLGKGKTRIIKDELCLWKDKKEEKQGLKDEL